LDVELSCAVDIETQSQYDKKKLQHRKIFFAEGWGNDARRSAWIKEKRAIIPPHSINAAAGLTSKAWFGSPENPPLPSFGKSNGFVEFRKF